METEILLLVATVVIIAVWFAVSRSRRSGVVEGDEPLELITVTEEDLSVYTKNQLVVLLLRLGTAEAVGLEERWLQRQTKPRLKQLLVGQVVPADFFGE